MGRIVTSIYVDKELWNMFTKKIAEKYGARRGVIAKAIEEAIRLWLRENT